MQMKSRLKELIYMPVNDKKVMFKERLEWYMIMLHIKETSTLVCYTHDEFVNKTLGNSAPLFQNSNLLEQLTEKLLFLQCFLTYILHRI